MIESGLGDLLSRGAQHRTVRLSGEFVEFGSFFVRFHRHSVSKPCCPLQLVIFTFLKTIQLCTLAPRRATDAGVCRGLLAPS